MTEDEAKTKVCCSSPYTKCQASACMAWVWDVQIYDTAQQKVIGNSDVYKRSDVVSRVDKSNGYCGLTKRQTDAWGKLL